GMREEVQADLAEAFDDPDGLADAVKPVAGSRTVKGGYDPAIGGTVPADKNGQAPAADQKAAA
ncbi:MAG: hypothetical protein RR983_10245, partial [Massilia sp.]